MPLIDKLPDSSREGSALFVVILAAVFAASCRVLYGKNDLSWRYTLGSMGVSAVVGVIIYALLVHQFGAMSGYLTVATGAACGTFTDDFLKRLRMVIDKNRLPQEPPSESSPK